MHKISSQAWVSTLSLFGSTGTLLCCALPALFVSIGAGAAFAGMVSAAPWLVTLSKYKAWTFGISGLLIMIAGWMRWRSRNEPCPIDEKKARACAQLRKLSGIIYGVSVFIWAIGFFFAFVAVHIFY
jgi:hypothetical protein